MQASGAVLEPCRTQGRAVPVANGVAWRGEVEVLPPCPHCTRLSSYCTEEYFYICNVRCKMRERKELSLLKKKNSAKEKNPNTCLYWVFTVGIREIIGGYFMAGLGMGPGFQVGHY